MPKPHSNAELDQLSISNMGVNCGVHPRLLPPNQLAFGVNITNRGGLPKTRPVWRKVRLTYAASATHTAAEVETLATEKLFQVGSFYQAYGAGENCLVAMVGGRVFRYLLGNGVVQDISLSGEMNDPVNPNGWMWQAEDFLIINNGAANPLFFDGAGLVRSLGPGGAELPPGCMGRYVQGRVWMTLPNDGQQPSQEFMAGDLVYSHGFTDGYDGRRAVLKIEELQQFSGGATFAVPVESGPITAMGVVAIADTSLGQGPLQVFTANSVTSVQVPLLRGDWFTGNQLQVVGLPGYGAMGARGVAAVNGDLWYRSRDGLRSFQVGRRDMGSWVQTPLSVEMEKVLQEDVEGLLGWESVLVFDNRLLVTVSPRSDVVGSRGVYHKGVVALDFNNLSTLTTRSQPVYDGLWTGLDVLQIVKGMFSGVERCFAWALDANRHVCLYELVKDGDGMFDWNGTENVPVKSSIESKALGWRDEGNALKKLYVLDLYLDRVAGPGVGTVAFDFKYRTDMDPVWVDWKAFELCAKVESCELGCEPWALKRVQYRTFIRLPMPADNVCSQVTKRPKSTGYEFQVRLEGTGYWQLNKMHVWAIPMGDSVVQSCPTSETCVVLEGCDLEWFDYEIERGP